MTLRLGILVSHPIQYHAPLFRELTRYVDLKVYFAHRQTARGQAGAGFNVAFEWDVDLLGGYSHRFLRNRARHPSTDHFAGCDTPEIGEEIRQGHFDAFLVMGWYLKSYWQAVRTCRSLRVPVMVRGDSQLGTARNWLKRILKEPIYPCVLRQFDACLYVGEKNREYLERYGVPVERLFFSPNCIDNSTFGSQARAIDRLTSRGKMGIKPKQCAVLFVGKLLDVKRPRDLIEALHILRGDGVDAIGVFAGDGPLRGALERQGLERQVPLAFLGFCNQTALPEVYAVADVLVLPSGSESWGLVVNEALACGTPVVVSSAVGCAPDLAIPGRTGTVFEVGNVRSLVAAIKRVIATPPLAMFMAQTIDKYSVAAAARGIVGATEWLQSSRRLGRDSPR
jgi:glycosyltransferase involved in cell wall biosynthesis